MSARGLPAAAALLLLTTGCASFQVNPPLSKDDYEAGHRDVKPTGYRYTALERPAANTEETFVVLTLSGGGTRAAALAYGAMRHLEDTRIEGGTKTLLDEVDVISSVSGGSFAAAYYVLSDNKEEFFEEFPEAVLYRRIQSALLRRVLAPWNWPRLWSPRFGRSDLLNLYYDKHIFKGATYGSLRQSLPLAILNGTDMSLGAQFPFTQDDFDRLCSDLAGVKVSRAVISSSAFPGGFTPLTWRNYPKRQCGYEAPPFVDLAFGDDISDRGDLESNPRRWDRARVWKSYEQESRSFIHVIDGGAADNIGLRGPLVAITSNDSPWSVLNKVNLDRIKRVVVITVDAKPRNRPKRDTKASPPGIFSVLSAAASKPMANYSTETVELLREHFEDWDKAALDYEAAQPLCDQLADRSCRNAPRPQECRDEAAAKCRELFVLQAEDRPPHPDLYRVHVRLDAIANPKLRRELQAVPTSLQLPRATVDRLVDAAADLLEGSEEFQSLKQDLGPPGP